MTGVLNYCYREAAQLAVDRVFANNDGSLQGHDAQQRRRLDRFRMLLREQHVGST